MMLLKIKVAAMAGAVIVLTGSLYALADASSAGGSQSANGESAASGISVTLHQAANANNTSDSSATTAPSVQNPFQQGAIPATSDGVAAKNNSHADVSTGDETVSSNAIVTVGGGKFVKVGDQLWPLGKWKARNDAPGLRGKGKSDHKDRDHGRGDDEHSANGGDGND